MTTIYVADAFITDKPFSGDPAGICILESWKHNSWMQQVAAEMKHSETAFVVKNEEGFSLRYFTPTIEIPLCGHATLASAFILWDEHIVPATENIVFFAKGGTLNITKEKDTIHMDFPISESTSVKEIDTNTLDKLKINASSVYQSNNDFVYALETEEELKSYKPDFSVIKSLPHRMTIITAQSSQTGIDFVSRVFAPNAGIDEDPAPGVAHCILGPQWAERLKNSKLKAFQASQRGAHVELEIQDNRIQLSGKVKKVLKGTFYG